MKRVLIVDDKPENLYLLRALLQGSGYAVDDARHGAEALVKARQAPPHLIISDLLMPVMDGYTLLRQWKADERLKDIPFVVYTATYTEPKDERLALDLGADAFIVKPAEPEPFMARIEEVLAKDRGGELSPAKLPKGDEKLLLKEYSEVLIRKLEEKALQLEEANRMLVEDLARRQQVEAALSEVQTRLLRAEARAHVGTWELDLVSHSGWWSPEMYRLFGRDPALGPPSDPDAFAGFLELLHPEDRRFVAELHTQAVETGQSVVGEFRTNPERGAVRDVRLISEPVHATSGDLIQLTGTVLDITERKRAEVALREANRKLESIINNLPGFVYRVANTPSWPVEYISEGVFDVVGYRAADFLSGKLNGNSIVAPADRDRVWSETQKALQTRHPYVLEYRMVTATGEERQVWEKGAGIFEGDHSVALEGFVQDITERKQAEAALLISEAELATAQVQAKLGNWVADLTTGKATWSREMYRLFGRDPALGVPPVEEILALAHPHDRAAVHAYHEHALREGTQGVIEFRSDPSRGPVRCFVGNTTIGTDASGKATRLFGTVQDVTERKRADLALEESHHQRSVELLSLAKSLGAELPLETRLQDLCRRVVDLIACDRSSIFLREGRYYRATCNHGNPPDIAERFPRHRVRLDDPLISQAVSNRRFVVINDPSSSPLFDPALARTARIRAIAVAPFLDDAGEPLGFVTAEYNENLGTFSELSATLLLGLAKVAERSVVAVQDQQERESLRESLRSSELMAAMGSLLAGVAHEVRNPLFGISATLDAFEARFGSVGQQHLQMLREQIQRLNDLMRDLLQYGKPEGMALTSASLGSVVGEAIRGCASLAEQSQVTVEVDEATPCPPLAMDRDRMRQAVQNLLQNAVQLSSAGGRVRISTRVAAANGQQSVECEVTDAGPGFRPEDLPHVFEPFFSRRRGGTGLGLAIAKRIVEQHGGTISAANRAEGGAVLTVRLPVGRLTAEG